MSEESRVFGITLIILLNCLWISILLFPIFYKYIPVIWGWISDKVFCFLDCVKRKIHHLPLIRRRGKRK